MLQRVDPQIVSRSARDWLGLLDPYRKPQLKRSILELIATAVPVGRVVGAGVARAFSERLADALAVHSSCWFPGAAVPHPARLRPRFIFPQTGNQRLVWPYSRRSDIDAIRCLAAQSLGASCEHRKSRSAWRRRHKDADGERIPCVAAVAPHDVSHCIVTHWFCSALVLPISF